MQNETNKSIATSNTYSKKIGRTVYNVQIFFSKSTKENFNDKVMRLIKNDIANGAKGA